MPDSQPNYLSVDPVTGAVTATFTGGLKLPLPDNTLFGNKIQWVREDNGGMVAQISSQWNSASDNSSLLIQTRPPDGTAFQVASLDLTSDDDGGVFTRIKVQAGLQFRTLLDANGNSDFRQDTDPIIIPACKAYRAGGSNNHTGTIPFDGEFFDNAGMHSNSTNNTRVTITEAGIYIISCFNKRDVGGSSSPVSAQLLKNTNTIAGAGNVSSPNGNQTGDWFWSVSIIENCDVGDYFEVYVPTGYRQGDWLAAAKIGVLS